MINHVLEDMCRAIHAVFTLLPLLLLSQLARDGCLDTFLAEWEMYDRRYAYSRR